MEDVPHKKVKLLAGRFAIRFLISRAMPTNGLFVAVPSQRAAGVVKTAGETPRNEEMLLRKPVYAAERDLVLSPAEQQELTGLLGREHQESGTGRTVCGRTAG